MEKGGKAGSEKPIGDPLYLQCSQLLKLTLPGSSFLFLSFFLSLLPQSSSAPDLVTTEVL